MSDTTKVQCPKCGRKQPARAGDAKDIVYFCPNCKGQFDNDPDEGGTHGHRPESRMEREERNRERRWR